MLPWYFEILRPGGGCKKEKFLDSSDWRILRHRNRYSTRPRERRRCNLPDARIWCLWPSCKSIADLQIIMISSSTTTTTTSSSSAAATTTIITKTLVILLLLIIITILIMIIMIITLLIIVKQNYSFTSNHLNNHYITVYHCLIAKMFYT